jgi:hypothetical protein
MATIGRAGGASGVVPSDEVAAQAREYVRWYGVHLAASELRVHLATLRRICKRQNVKRGTYERVVEALGR